MLIRLPAVAVLAAACLTATAQTPATVPASAPTPDLCKGCISPYNPSAERQRFFAAAGVDNELTSGEAEADRRRDKPFVRPFDRWEAMAKFDKNGSRTLDWFEADAYRRDVKKRVLGAFDANKDGRLAGPERDKANRALAAGKIPAAAPTGSVRVAAVPAGGSGGERGEGGEPVVMSSSGNGVVVQQRRMNMRYREEFDADKDGELSDDERQAMMEHYRARAAEARRRRQLQRYDKNGDGQLDADETAAMEAERAERRRRVEERRREFMSRWDQDGDGELNDAERNNMRDHFRQQAAEWRSQWTARWDADGDGELSEEENRVARQRMGEAMQRAREEMDGDGDGNVSREERQAWFADLMEEYDADDNGRLDWSERRKLMTDRLGPRADESP